MKGHFKSKKKKIKKRKRLFFFIMFLTGLISSFLYLDKHMKKIDQKEFVEILLNEANFKNDNSLKKIVINTLNNYKLPVELIFNEYSNKLDNNTSNNKSKKTFQDDSQKMKELIYIYNSHQSEEYSTSNYLEFTVRPTVMIADYILEDYFLQNNIKSIVEERKIKDILNQNNWKYYNSYKASRLLMEDVVTNNNSLKYFIDVHRDSLGKDRTTVVINDKSYAKILFLIGLENEKYQENLEFTEKINNKINEKYPNLSKGILKKGGEGVNGVYNQDFSKYTILIEIGGSENTPSEVLNSALAFGECFLEVINTIEG